ncbi:MAG TPA: TadE/TadG family type IV pilus assembly protein [Gemmatimonadaceae bacterium]
MQPKEPQSAELAGAPRLILPLLARSVFWSAALLFLMQPMFGKMILPVFGGAPAVWIASLVFFQLMLLAGYLYVHASLMWLAPRKQAALHAALMLVPMRKRRLFGERGAAMVEFAVASSAFFLLISGAIAFGHAIFQYNIVANAAKAGVRWTVVRGSSSSQTAATTADVHNSILTQMNGYSEFDTVTWSPDTKQGSVVTVVVHSSFATPAFPLLRSYTLQLRSAAQMVIMR